MKPMPANLILPTHMNASLCRPGALTRERFPRTISGIEPLNPRQAQAIILSRSGSHVSLSPGERAGVRAGVLKTNFAVAFVARAGVRYRVPPFNRFLENLSFAIIMSLLALALSLPATVSAADTGKLFPSPAAAVAALKDAVNTKDREALQGILGPAAADLENPDQVQAASERQAFAAALNATNRLVPASDTRCVLEVGEQAWPFPIPLVKQADGQWYFDTEAGKEEILNRRVGRNELATLQSVRAYVAAQREYASQDRLGNGVLQYAQQLNSTPGRKDGLYWPTNLDGEISPLGPSVAAAQAAGYGGQNAGVAPEPFHGYYFKILTRQGKHAPGGKYAYVIHGNMIGGFALVAWPAEYGNSGIMTFLVNQQGRVYQKDLGPQTGQRAPAINSYDPDSTWQLSPN